MRLPLYGRVEVVAKRTLLLLGRVMVVGMPVVVLMSVMLRLGVLLVEMLVRHDAMHQYQCIGKKGKQQQGDLLRH